MYNFGEYKAQKGMHQLGSTHTESTWYKIVRETGGIHHHVKDHVHRRPPDWFVVLQQQTKGTMVVDPSATDQAHGLVQCLLQKQTGSADRPSL